MVKTATHWWKDSLSYSRSQLQPPIDMSRVSGPLGPAYVSVYEDGTTAPGWGEQLFMTKYLNRAFHARRAQVVYERYDQPFALVMRSVAMVAIDIDGKNDGFASAAGLLLPPTLAETSRSGNGYHLFYLMEDTWDPVKGFAAQGDRIGFRPGIDIRGTGCVFHYPSQMWNGLDIARLPQHLEEDLRKHSSNLEARVAEIIQLRDSSDPDDQEEFLVMQDTIASKLTQPIPAGKRNNTLFAIGAEMATAGIQGWEQQVYDRAIQLGLPDAEATKLVGNIRKYG